MAYYIQIRNKAFGPFNTEQLSEMKFNGKISRTTLISENKIDWVNAENLEFLFTVAAKNDQQVSVTTNASSALSTVTWTPEPVNWFYSLDGKDGYGPVTVSAIIQMINSGTLHPDSVAWQEGQFAKKLIELPQFSKQFNNTLQNKNTSGTVDSVCSSCGSQFVPSSNFCPNCGTSRIPNSDSINSTGIGYADVLKKYADFNDRARRSEYWRFTVYNQIILPLVLISLGIILIFVLTAFGVRREVNIGVVIVLSAVYLLYNLLIFLPSLAVCVRRLHDTGNSGWMILMMLIPIVGFIILFILLIQDSQPATNKYGINPKFGE
jgi:uncharacterized membrane protein YhaH (DUF805 family)/predicted RNA-binding Zn-ribbon protein involved in translation (DUF1610 family)